MTVEKFLVDTNILIRLIVKDSMVEQLYNLIQRVENNEIVLVVDPLVFAESIFVLQGYRNAQGARQFKRAQIAAAMEALLDTEGFEVFEKESLRTALQRYSTFNVDFVDAFLAAQSKPDLPVVSFDGDIPKLTANTRHPTTL